MDPFVMLTMFLIVAYIMFSLVVGIREMVKLDALNHADRQARY